jgi:tetratricopeptide (TPR) repeat protein
MKLASLLATLSLAATGAATAGAASAQAPAFNANIDGLANGWARANFETHDNASRAAESEKVAAAAAALAAQYPTRAEPLVWEAIAVATEGGAKGGLSGLGKAKEARRLLEHAEAINPAALGDGSVYTTLGSLYAQVPGFPVGFGDPQKARTYFQKALAANPNGLDSNFFYGDFLARQGDTAGAVRALEKAIAAPPRPGREIADKGRHAEATALLAQVRAKARS